MIIAHGFFRVKSRNSQENQTRMSKNQELKRVMLVDDAPLIANALSRVLVRRGEYDVMVCENGHDCLRLAPQFKPDVIILDVMMPEIDGFETCRRLKEIPGMAQVPVLFMSAAGETKNKVEGLHLGAVDYLTKPVQTEELLARLKTHLTISQLQNSLLMARDEYKSLVHMMCHDLANYLGSVKGFADLTTSIPMEGEKGLQDMKQFMGKIQNISTRATDFLNQIREYNASKEEKYEVQNVPVNLRECIEESKAVFNSKLDSKDLKLNCSQVSSELSILADPRWFVLSVLNNLISNAIKFSYEGSTITLSAQAVEGRVSLCVRDEGVGISQKLLEKLFDPAHAISTEGTNQEAGTGFGMPLVKQWVEAFGGTIQVESKQKSTSPDDHGTAFTMNFKKA